MKANELRIGNWYHFADNDGIVYRRVKEIKQNEFGLFGDYDGVNFEICQPIPLTEEWLVRFGFEYLYFNSEELIHKEFKNLYAYKHVMNDGFGIVLRGFHALPFVKHVHQLQNLYFALTGEELTLSE